LKAFSPRPKQQEVLDYPGGRMGVAAVPGSGKTWTLSRLAASIVASGELADDQEVLVVTLVNSAVDNFYQRVSAFVEEYGLLPHLNYRVRTLHGLAHDIVRERPELVGLAEDFQIVDEREGDDIAAQASRAWLSSHPGALDGYLSEELDDNNISRVYRESLPDLVKSIGTSFIRSAKDKRLTPERLGERLAQLPVSLPLAHMGWEIYADYQRALAYRGAVDFDDLIRLALDALSLDEKLLERLRRRWPYILEDEAQDSSQLQEEILRLLVGETGNWVRVGDPNQAIYETFTTANPRYLRAFISSRGVLRRELPNSGRSTLSIIDLANALVDWTMHRHPAQEVRDALSAPPFIQPTPPGDPQPNPPDDPAQVHLVLKNYSADGEIRAVVDSLERWLPDHPQDTVAVLVSRNDRADKVVDALERRDIEVVQSLLRNTSSTRSSARVLRDVLNHLADPGSPRKLADAYQAWCQAGGEPHSGGNVELLRKCSRVEDFLWPLPGGDWLEMLQLADDDPLAYERLLRFRELARRWQASVLLPVDQAVLALAQDMFTETADLAIPHKTALLLRRASDVHPAWRLPELTEGLSVIARNERRFLGFHQDEMGFDPDRYPGKVVVSTMHKAKGLEWDRVYLMSVNSYDFPSGDEHDRYIAEKWFIRDRLNLEAETLEQLEAILRPGEYEWYQEERATIQARLDYVRERLRLLYVGITRARKELVITYNSGRKGEQGMAKALVSLVEYWDGKVRS
jgi:DNA helicase-2/ATP-dependent DNA helicase PcrA